MKNLLKRILAPIIGGAHFQKLLNNIHALSLIGMNVGGGGDTKNSGEEFVIKYINKVYESQSDLVVFDVGSNIGDYAILLSEILEPNTSIYCFEPSKATYAHLTKNTSNIKNIQLFNIG